MQFLTASQCEEWLRGRDRTKPCADNSAYYARFSFPKEAGRLCWLSRQIATALMQHREPCLLWIEEWGICEENLHLYYRLRLGYGDQRLLSDAPGHLFLGFEAEDLATFLQISMLNGWGGTSLTHLDYFNAFFSHDEYLDLFSYDEGSFNALRTAITT